MAGDPTDDPSPSAADRSDAAGRDDPAEPGAPGVSGVPGAADAPGSPRTSERLRARAEATDRERRFEQRLAEVHRVRERRRRVRRLARIGWVVVLAGVGGLAPIVVAAVLTAPDPTGNVLLGGAAVGAVLGAVGPGVRNWLARRRGSRAWDAYSERYVLLGDPSVDVRDADQSRTPGPRSRS